MFCFLFFSCCFLAFLSLILMEKPCFFVPLKRGFFVFFQCFPLFLFSLFLASPFFTFSFFVSLLFSSFFLPSCFSCQFLVLVFFLGGGPFCFKMFFLLVLLFCFKSQYLICFRVPSCFLVVVLCFCCFGIFVFWLPMKKHLSANWKFRIPQK